MIRKGDRVWVIFGHKKCKAKILEVDGNFVSYRIPLMFENSLFMGMNITETLDEFDERTINPIPKEKWMPEIGSPFWVIEVSFDGVETCKYTRNNESDEKYLDQDNYFRTREEAEAKAEEIRRLLAK